MSEIILKDPETKETDEFDYLDWNTTEEDILDLDNLYSYGLE